VPETPFLRPKTLPPYMSLLPTRNYSVVPAILFVEFVYKNIFFLPVAVNVIYI